METPATKSIGERRVRIDFNPSNQDSVYLFKRACAELINEAERIKQESDDPEVKRLAALAATDFETGAMYLVKAATAGK